MLSGETTPSQLGLFNLGFDASDGEAILEKIVDKQFYGFSELRLDGNPEFWQAESCCSELLYRLLSTQTQIDKLFLACRETGEPYATLLEQDLPEIVQQKL